MPVGAGEAEPGAVTVGDVLTDTVGLGTADRRALAVRQALASSSFPSYPVPESATARESAALVFLPEWRALANPEHMIPCYAGVARKA